MHTEHRPISSAVKSSVVSFDRTASVALTYLFFIQEKLIDMLLDDKIIKEAYDAKYNEATREKMCLSLQNGTRGDGNLGAAL